MKRVLFIAGLFLGMIASHAFADDIIVAGAANVQFPLEDLKAAFVKETGIGIKTVIGSSGQLTAQIKNGAPFDVFLSADMKYPAVLYRDGFSSKPARVYARGVLVLWTLKNLDLTQGVAVLNNASVQKIALANPRLAPYGREALRVLSHYQLDTALRQKLVFGESIAQVNALITTGAADIGFSAKSVVVSDAMKHQGRWCELNPKSYQPIAQGVVLLKYAQTHHIKQAQAFYDFLFSFQARKIFKRYGYQIV